MYGYGMIEILAQTKNLFDSNKLFSCLYKNISYFLKNVVDLTKFDWFKRIHLVKSTK